MLTSRGPRLLHLVALAAAGAAAGFGCNAPELKSEEVERVAQELRTDHALLPTSDVVKTNVSGVGSTSLLFQNVDDGTTFAASDDSTTYVRTTTSSGTHRAGYSGGPAGSVKKVVLNYRARRVSSTGTSQANLYQGSTLIASAPVRTLADTWSNFSETFDELNLPNVNDLRTEVVLTRTSGTGHLRYTMVWMVATIESDVTPPTVTINSPANNATIRGPVQVTANVTDNEGISYVEFWVDNAPNPVFTAAQAPYSFRWDTFNETFATHTAGKHKLRARAVDAAGNSSETEIFVSIVPVAHGDCNADGTVTAADVTALQAEIADGDGSDTESATQGTHLGNPSCDANQDNVIDSADQSCINLIAGGQPAEACYSTSGPVVVPLIFVPSDMTSLMSDGSIAAFVAFKVQEARRFYARFNNGKTFRALPVQVVNGTGNKASYWGPNNNAYEGNVLAELQQRGYPAHPDWVQTPTDRVTWVLGMGGGGFAGGRHYATGHGFALWGDALLFSGMDLNCSRVQPAFTGDNIQATCNGWFNSGKIYGFGVGAAIHELGHGFNLPHPDEGSPDWGFTVMGHHWNYPFTGLVEDNRTILGVSHFFPGFSDSSGPVPSFNFPGAGGVVYGQARIDGGVIDNYGIRSMKLFIDNVEQSGLEKYIPYRNDFGGLGFRKTWDTTGLANGSSHTLRIDATDSSGLTSSTSVTVTVQNASPPAELFWLQGETPVVSSAPMAVASDAAASGGQYISVPSGTNSTGAAPENGRALYTFWNPATATYKFWGRVIAPNTSTDSFWVRVDGGTWINWNNIAPSTSWVWDEVHNSSAGNQVVQVSLGPGEHSIEFAYREGGTKLDRLLVTNNLSYVPSGTGP